MTEFNDYIPSEKKRKLRFPLFQWCLHPLHCKYGSLNQGRLSLLLIVLWVFDTSFSLTKTVLQRIYERLNLIKQELVCLLSNEPHYSKILWLMLDNVICSMSEDLLIKKKKKNIYIYIFLDLYSLKMKSVAIYFTICVLTCTYNVHTVYYPRKCCNIRYTCIYTIHTWDRVRFRGRFRLIT